MDHASLPTCQGDISPIQLFRILSMFLSQATVWECCFVIPINNTHPWFDKGSSLIFYLIHWAKTLIRPKIKGKKRGYNTFSENAIFLMIYTV